MKYAYSSLLLFFFFFAAAAQTETKLSPPDVIVVKKQWYKEVNNPAFEKSPFAGAEEMQRLSRDRRAVRRENARRVQRGLPALRTPTSAQQAEPENDRSPDIYTYKLRVTNSGGKQIKSLVWDYVFYAAGTENEVGRIQFEYDIKIDSGKTKDLSISTEIAPSKTIDVKATGKKLRDQYSERIIIQSIEYSDGSVWQRAEESAQKPNV
jgi:hypothetical protein